VPRLADALKVNSRLTKINLNGNSIGDEGALALVDALKVNTSVTFISLRTSGIDESHVAQVDALVARNKRLRHLFLFDARQMLLSVMSADECGVVWPYVLDGDNMAAVKARSGDQTLRAAVAVVVEERRRQAATAAVRLDAAEVDDKGGSRAVKRRRTKR
jgi:hypothetical protein